jgi:superfamily II DNA or RNA helicase
MSEITLKLKYEAGTLILEGAEENDFVPNAFVWDKRTRQFRSPAYKYREIIKEFIRTKTAYEDSAKRYDQFAFKQKFHVAPRPYQTASVEAWRANERCGVIVLPTGAGKTHVATMAIEMCGRQTLVVVPDD